MKEYASKFVSSFICITVLLSSYCAVEAYAFSKEQKTQIECEVKRLREEVEIIQSECNAIDSRLNAVNKMIAKNYVDLEQAENQCSRQKEEFSKRLREIYKHGDIGLLEVILNIRDFEDLLLRVSYLQKINESNSKLFTSCYEKREKIACIREDLEKTKQEEINLKKQKLEKLAHLKNKLVEEQSLLDKADSELRAQIEKEEEAKKQKKQTLMAQSVPLGAQVETVSCNVFPYLDHTYLTSVRFPSTYRATGIEFSGVTSWYGNEFNGQPTASGEIFNENDFTCASRTLPFGTYLAVAYGDKRIVVKVTDRGPFIKGRILDLSKAAAKALGISGIGVVNVGIVEPE